MARDFNGAGDQYITHTLAASQTGMTDITIAAWLYADSNSQFKRFFERNDTSSGADQDLKWEFDDAWGFVFKGGWSTSGAWSIAKPSTGAWFHACVTYSFSATTNDPIMYINGVSQTVTERATPSGTVENDGTTLTTGANAGGGFSGVGSWDGRIAEFAIWNRILTAGEAASLGKAFAPSFMPRGLVFYLPLIGRTSPEIELMKGSSGTLTGPPVNIAHPRIS